MSNKPHPEDEIYKVKTFVNELQKVQEEYFTKLVENLNLSKEGEDRLFDYIYNSDKNEFDDFQHYLNDFNKKYEDMIKKDKIYIDPAETFLSTDFGEFSPMLSMSLFEPNLESFSEEINNAKDYGVKFSDLISGGFEIKCKNTTSDVIQ